MSSKNYPEEFKTEAVSGGRSSKLAVRVPAKPVCMGTALQFA
jgi:hypothetical protein